MKPLPVSHRATLPARGDQKKLSRSEGGLLCSSQTHLTSPHVKTHCLLTTSGPDSAPVRQRQIFQMRYSGLLCLSRGYSANLTCRSRQNREKYCFVIDTVCECWSIQSLFCNGKCIGGEKKSQNVLQYYIQTLLGLESVTVT